MKIYFLCNECGKYNSVEADKHNLDYYDGVETSYCPTCDDEKGCEIGIGIKPIGWIFKF